MTVIITGAAGVLGGTLAREARRRGLNVIGIGRAQVPPPEWTSGGWVNGDLTNAELRRRDWAQHRGAAVLHLAADTRIYEGRDFTREALAAAATAAAVARATGGPLVFFSSSAVYSGAHTRRPICRLIETDETNPGTAYGRAKLAVEEWLLRSVPRTTVLRVFGVLSERLMVAPPRGNLVQAIHRALTGDGEFELALDEKGEAPVRDYVLDEDVCRVALAAAAGDGAVPAVVNVCTGIGTSARELIELASEAAGRPLRVRGRMQSGAVNPVMVGDPTALNAWLGWRPRNRSREFWQRMTTGRPGVRGSPRDVVG